MNCVTVVTIPIAQVNITRMKKPMKCISTKVMESGGEAYKAG